LRVAYPQRRYQARQGLGITEISTAPPLITGAPTSIALFVGWAPSGPTDRALPLFSFSDYEREFGGLDARSLLGYAVRHFFDNGGSQAWVLRIVGADGYAIAPTEPAFVQALNVAFSSGGPVDRIDLFNLICVPGLADAAATAMLQAQAAARRAFLIADCNESAQAATVADSLAGRTGVHAANSALYFPWVMAPDPLQKGAPRAFPPSGFVAGVVARTDAARGVWKSPAGSDVSLIGAADLAVHLTDVESESLNRQGINCLRQFPGRGLVVWGARTLAGGDGIASDWKYVPVRRTALFLEESISAGTKWAVFEPNDEPLWGRLRMSVGSFMLGLFRQQVFAGNTPLQAWFVKCDQETTTQDDIDRGVVNIIIGFAPLRPAEFVVVSIAQLARAN
jgi:phage tail sheath protein FI